MSGFNTEGVMPVAPYAIKSMYNPYENPCFGAYN